MEPPPKHWPRIWTAVFYDDARAAIDWLCTSFGFGVRIKVEGDDGTIEHSELELPNDGLIMVSQTDGPPTYRKNSSTYPVASTMWARANGSALTTNPTNDRRMPFL